MGLGCEGDAGRNRRFARGLQLFAKQSEAVAEDCFASGIVLAWFAPNMSTPDRASLRFNDKELTLPVTVGSEGECGIDISKLRQEEGAIEASDEQLAAVP